MVKLDVAPEMHYYDICCVNDVQSGAASHLLSFGLIWLPAVSAKKPVEQFNKAQKNIGNDGQIRSVFLSSIFRFTG